MSIINFPISMKRITAFTTIELILAISIITILSSAVLFNAAGAQNRTNLDTTINVIINEIKNQQNKAMTGNRENRSSYDAYGIYFQSDKYILFHGPAYNPTDQTNFAINLTTGISFSNINLPNNQIVFASFSGEIANYSDGNNTVTISSQNTGQQKTITINRYGVITSVN